MDNILPESLSDPRKRVVGMRQVLKLAECGELEEIFVAQDADDGIKENIMVIANKNGIRYTQVLNKEELGRICGIKVHAACAGLMHKDN